MPVSSPATLTIVPGTFNQVQFAIPGVGNPWAAAKWELVGTVSGLTSPNTGVLSVITGGLLHSVTLGTHGNGVIDDTQDASLDQVSDINAQAGGTLTVRIGWNAPGGSSIAMSSFVLTLINPSNQTVFPDTLVLRFSFPAQLPQYDQTVYVNPLQLALQMPAESVGGDATGSPDVVGLRFVFPTPVVDNGNTIVVVPDPLVL